MLVRVMIWTPTRNLQKRLYRLLETGSLILGAVPKVESLLKTIGTDPYDLLIVQEHVLPKPSLEWIQMIRGLPDPPEIVLFQDEENPERRALWLSQGVLAVLNESLSDPVLGQTLNALVERKREALIKDLKAPQDRDQMRLSDFASYSPKMEQLVSLARRVATADSSLMILGETGVGKEWLAHAIHNISPRAPFPFIAVNCAAFPETLLESELFGHEKGAFTGAQKARRGYFEMANQGTLFLDEIGDMPLHLQIKLLRVLQERQIQRLGGEVPIRVDVRLMAATNRDLLQDMKDGIFRRDLYYRLGVVTLEVPPLRARQEDIPVLAKTYLTRFARQFKKNVTEIEETALQALISYAWPGNVRELINLMERAVLLGQGTAISITDLPETLAQGFSEPQTAAAQITGIGLPKIDTKVPLKTLAQTWMTALEQEYVRLVLHENRGHQGKAARQAGLTPRALYNKMKKWGWDKADFK